MVRRFLLPLLGTTAVAALVVAPSAGAARAERTQLAKAPVTFAEGSCVGSTCAPPNGGVPGLDPPRLPFAETAAPCDGTEPEFSLPAGNPQLNRADSANPVLRRTYSWYRVGNDPTPIKWGAHCDVWLAPIWDAARPTILMPEVTVAGATVPARIAVANTPVLTGVAVELPAVTVPRKAPEEAYTVIPTATLTDVRWVGSENCDVTPLPSSAVLATVKVRQPFDPTATGTPACVTIETTWEYKATRTFTTGAKAGTNEAMNSLLGSKGQLCGDACTVTRRSTDAGASVVLQEEGVAQGPVATPAGEPTVQGTAVSGGECRSDCAQPSLGFGATRSGFGKVRGDGGNEISSGFIDGDGLGPFAVVLGAALAVGMTLGLLRRRGVA